MFAAISAAAAVQNLDRVKYVFLFIGDGMSIPQRMMTDEFLRLGGGDGLLINKLPNNAITYTRSANLYPTRHTVSRYFGCEGLSSIFSRILRMNTVMLLSSTLLSRPQMCS